MFQQIPLGTHDLFLADVVAVNVSEELLDAAGKLHLERAGLLAYAHGQYYSLGEEMGTLGWSVRKSSPRPERARRRKSPPLKKQRPTNLTGQSAAPPPKRQARRPAAPKRNKSLQSKSRRFSLSLGKPAAFACACFTYPADPLLRGAFRTTWRHSCSWCEPCGRWPAAGPRTVPSAGRAMPWPRRLLTHEGMVDVHHTGATWGKVIRASSRVSSP